MRYVEYPQAVAHMERVIREFKATNANASEVKAAFADLKKAFSADENGGAERVKR